MPVEIELPFLQLVPIPGDVDVNRVDAQRAITVERNFPEISRNAVIEKRRRVNEERIAIDVQFRIAAMHDDFNATRARRNGR